MIAELTVKQMLQVEGGKCIGVNRNDGITQACNHDHSDLNEMFQGINELYKNGELSYGVLQWFAGKGMNF